MMNNYDEHYDFTAHYHLRVYLMASLTLCYIILKKLLECHQKKQRFP